MVGAEQYCRIITILNAYRYLLPNIHLPPASFRSKCPLNESFVSVFFANTRVPQSAGCQRTGRTDDEDDDDSLYGNMRKLSWTEQAASRSRNPCGSRWWNYPTAVWWAANESHLSPGRLWSRADRSWWGLFERLEQGVTALGLNVTCCTVYISEAHYERSLEFLRQPVWMTPPTLENKSSRRQKLIFKIPSAKEQVC